MIKQISILFLLFWFSIGEITAGNPEERFFDDFVPSSVTNNLKFDHDLFWGKQNPGAEDYSDDFNLPSLRPHWLYKLDEKYWTLRERPGYLRLKAGQAASVSGLPLQQSVFQMLRTNTRGEAMVLFDVSSLREGVEAGLFFQNSALYSIVIYGSGTERRLKVVADGNVNQDFAIDGQNLMLRVRISGTSVCFDYAVDGMEFKEMGKAFPLQAYYGHDQRLGFYCIGSEAGRGYVDIDWFCFRQEKGSDDPFVRR
ncbi:MAG TPA: hypothetical protein PLK12_07545 [Prolixibacteraceae bacterium]|nr:hypothetical protein [Prolixibacteraceae bacterium]